MKIYLTMQSLILFIYSNNFFYSIVIPLALILENLEYDYRTIFLRRRKREGAINECVADRCARKYVREISLIRSLSTPARLLV